MPLFDNSPILFNINNTECQQLCEMIARAKLRLILMWCFRSPVNDSAFHQSHKIKKRSLYEETCPPPYVIEVTEKCKDTCLDDDYCVGNQMCCFDGCSYVCMDPVPSEAGT